MFWNMAKRDGDCREPVHIPKIELEAVDLDALVRMGEIAITKKETKNGHLANYYLALKPGSINPSLLSPPNSRPLDNLTTSMRKHLKRVTLKQGTGSTDFFDCFLKLNSDFRYLYLFFLIDKFSGRVHTPVSNFHREFRPNILLDGEPTGSLDVATMQPVLLGWILRNVIGSNEYSDWIDAGRDIYESIREKAKLKTRDEGKKRFFEIIFSRADKRLAAMFGNADWITWVNDFKSKEYEDNPHTMEKQHSNLAFLLQKAEVKIMREVWQGLHDAGIVFLSVHDEVIVKAKDIGDAELIFSKVLSRYFSYYKLNVKGCTNESEAISGTLVQGCINPPPPKETAQNRPEMGNKAGFPIINNNRVNLDEILRYMATIPEPSGPVVIAGGKSVKEPLVYINNLYQAVKVCNGKPDAGLYYDKLVTMLELCVK
jgi:hypothetical protein